MVSKFTGLCSLFSETSNMSDQYGPVLATASSALTGSAGSPLRKVGSNASSAGQFALA